MTVWRACVSRPRAVRWCGAAALTVAVVVGALTGCGASTQAGHVSAGTPTPSVPTIPPTYTPNPLTPAPTTEEQHLDALVWQAIGAGAVQVQTTYSAVDGTTDVQITYSQVVPIKGIVPTQDTDISAAQERVKTVCFEVEQALWTSGTTPLSQVNVAVLGPVLDQYANLTSQAYATALLKSATAAHFTWSTLTPDAAWVKYDNTYLRADYSDAD